nr:MAG TPA: hypothetical protein [Caudoviricetes sp.]
MLFGCHAYISIFAVDFRKYCRVCDFFEIAGHECESIQPAHERTKYIHSQTRK